MPPKKMEVNMSALENEVAVLKLTLAEMKAQEATDQERLVSLLTQTKNDTHSEKLVKKDGAEDDTGSSDSIVVKQLLQKLQGNTLDEFRQLVKKVELPMFNGDNPTGWIARAEVYFRVQGTQEELKVSLAQLCMDGPTIYFFKGFTDDDENMPWEKLKDALLERYGGLGDVSVFEQLSVLHQEGSVEEYIQEFERLVAQVPWLPDEQYLGHFIHGLREGIRGRVRSLKFLGPISRSRVLNVARVVEAELQEKRPN